MKVYCSSLKKLILHRTDLSMYDIAGFAFFKFITIHPFEDGNGRTARAIANLMLRLFGLPFYVDLSRTIKVKRELNIAIKTVLLREYRASSIRSCAKHIYQEVHIAMHSLLHKEKCSVCYEEMCGTTASGPVVTLNYCVHKFHYNCIQKWIKLRSNCPLCRAEINGLTKANGEVEDIRSVSIFITRARILLRWRNMKIYTMNMRHLLQRL